VNHYSKCICWFPHLNGRQSTRSTSPPPLRQQSTLAGDAVVAARLGLAGVFRGGHRRVVRLGIVYLHPPDGARDARDGGHRRLGGLVLVLRLRLLVLLLLGQILRT